MKSKKWIVGLSGVAVLLIVAALFFEFGGRSPELENPTPSPTSALAAPGAGPIVDEPNPETNSSATPTNSHPVAEAKPSSGSYPLRSPGKATPPPSKATPPHSEKSKQPLLEVPEPTETAPSGLPKSAPREQMLTAKPKAGEAVGKLAKGFPSKQLSLPENSSVVRSSINTQKTRVLVGVVGRTETKINVLVEFYRDYFVQRDWQFDESRLSDGAVRLHGQFADDSSTILIRALPTGMNEITASGSYKVGK